VRQPGQHGDLVTVLGEMLGEPSGVTARSR